MTVDTPLAPHPQATLHAPAPVASRPAPPAAHTQPAPQPRLVRATAPANGFPVEALIQAASSPPSILDVDPRLLVVRHAAPAPATSGHRSLAAPIDERREHRSMLRRRVLTAAAGAAAAVVSAASVGLALA
jgi:hypothetical protein